MAVTASFLHQYQPLTKGSMLIVRGYCLGDASGGGLSGNVQLRPPVNSLITLIDSQIYVDDLSQNDYMLFLDTNSLSCLDCKGGGSNPFVISRHTTDANTALCIVNISDVYLGKLTGSYFALNALGYSNVDGKKFYSLTRFLILPAG